MQKNGIIAAIAFLSVLLFAGGLYWWMSPPAVPTQSLIIPSEKVALPETVNDLQPSNEEVETEAELKENEPNSKEKPRWRASDKVKDNDEVIVVEGRPEDGGRAFGHAVCERQKACSCRRFPADVCLRTYMWVKPAEYSRVKCILDLDCEALCAWKTDERAASCREQVDETTKRHFDSRFRGDD